tara:strand:- start:630 stop:1499 length:870 start_codon:yes stop_codon:yes gene_type:complete
MAKKILLIILTSLSVSLCFAQDSLVIKKFARSYLREDQHFHFNIPLYIPTFKGNFSYGDVSVEPNDDIVDGDNPPDDGGGDSGDQGDNIFEKFFKTTFNLEFFFLGQMGYENQDFFIDADIYMGNIGGSLRWEASDKELIQLSVKSTLPRLISGYKIYHYESKKKTFKMSIAPYWGIRAQSIRIRSTTHPDFVNNFHLLSPLSIEPILGFRVPLNLRRWQITTQMDVGSFGIKKKWSYMTNIHASYRFSKLMAFRFGWTEFDLSKRSLFDNLTYKVHLRGPTVGLNFIF